MSAPAAAAADANTSAAANAVQLGGLRDNHGCGRAGRRLACREVRKRYAVVVRDSARAEEEGREARAAGATGELLAAARVSAATTPTALNAIGAGAVGAATTAAAADANEAKKARIHGFVRGAVVDCNADRCTGAGDDAARVAAAARAAGASSDGRYCAGRGA